MKLAGMLLGVVLCLSIATCGGASKTGIQASKATHTTGTVTSKTTVVSGTSKGGYLNDGDAEKIDDGDNDNLTESHEDTDGDSSEEYEETADNGKYHDRDDHDVVDFGHAANTVERGVIAAFVKRYYRAAVADDGSTACTMVVSSLAEALPEDYGGPAGQLYLRGAKTCQAVMSLLFKHSRKRVIGVLHVTGVRVEGLSAIALLGSETRPAGYMSLKRERGVWKAATLLAGPLP